MIATQSGYRHPAYCAALREFGTPQRLPHSNAWMLVRDIPRSEERDAMGCYPLFACANWDALPDDLEALRGELVSLVLVTDPFGHVDQGALAGCLDVLRPFKEHLVVDLGRAPDSFVSPHHQRNARKAAALVQVERCEDPAAHAREWISLYENLIAKHQIGGIARFSALSLEEQLRVPGIVMFRAVRNGETVGMLLWYEGEEVAYYHLGAYSDAGYELRASFALFDAALRHFRGRVPWLCLGAGAGASGADDDGLTRFKRGWATGSRTAYLAGRILDPHAYDTLVQRNGVSAVSYFPRYRAGEFA
jgi:hypothetical protein